MAADVLTNLVTSVGVDFANPVTLAINLIISTIVGGLVLLVLVMVIGREFSEEVHPANAFLVVLIINLVNLLGVLGFVVPYISFIPFLPVLLPVLVWIALVKIFFGGMKLTHAIILGVAGYLLSIFLIPVLVGFASGFVPSFG